MRITLLRAAQSEHGTFGVLVRDDLVPFALTLELPMRDNKKDVSCIPDGTYRCEPFASPTKGKVFKLVGVPGRTNVELHSGNIMSDSLGCILVGEAFEPIKGQDGIAYSRDAYAELLTLTNWQSFDLTIIDPPPSLRRFTVEV